MRKKDQVQNSGFIFLSHYTGQANKVTCFILIEKKNDSQAGFVMSADWSTIER
jgi:hypothetical protein